MSFDPLRAAYVRAVLGSYLALLDTPDRAHPGDRRVAEDLYRRNVPVPTVQNALLLAQARRLTSRENGHPLPPARSLAYFRGAIEEVVRQPLDDAYVRYLIRSISWLMRPTPDSSPPSAPVQKNPFSSER